jgi:cell division transport system permease protein
MTKLAHRQKRSRMSLRTYFAHHRHAWRHGFRQITKNPIASILTIAVISITLVLPTGLLLVLGNMQAATQNWNRGGNISVFMNSNINGQQIDFTRDAINKLSNIKNVSYISPEQGLKEFSEQTGLNNILSTLGDNPLPAVFVITPLNQTPPAVNMLSSQLNALPNIAAVKIDMQWIKRLNAMLNLLENFTYGLAILLAIAVLLIVGNTIRMNIQAYHQEIEVMKLVGASYRFIRRPFLYSGIIYGLCAAIFTAVILDFFFVWLQQPLNQLTALYNTQFSLEGLSFLQTLELMIVGIVLGFIGSGLVVGKYLKKIQPE